tara:strand:+ start:560 stop:673 length:114 start_codon:yes stop_codon:yes gene_type:complete
MEVVVQINVAMDFRAPVGVQYPDKAVIDITIKVHITV